MFTYLYAMFTVPFGGSLDGILLMYERKDREACGSHGLLEFKRACLCVSAQQCNLKAR